MNRLKKIVKTIWSFRRKIFFTLFVIGDIAITMQYLIDKEYELAFAQGMLTFFFIVAIVQSKAIEKLEELIKAKDGLIARQYYWIEKVKKIIKENS